MSGKNAQTIGDLAGVSRSSAQKFFNSQPISVESFQSLCKVLKLNWEEIAGLDSASSASARKRVAFVIEGSLDDLDPTKLAKLQAMVRALQQLTGDASMTTVDIEEGSIRLILEGSAEGIRKLKQLSNQGVLAKLANATDLVEVDFLEIEQVGEDYLKTLLISTILSQGASGKDLSDTDLRGANLRGANLRSANLYRADLSDADLNRSKLENANLRLASLSDANLSAANLNHAELYGASLNGVNFSNANLSDANLSDAQLGANTFHGTIVKGAIFGEGSGLSTSEKLDLQRRGAIFHESTGDREFLLR